jgi:glycosyltransferase involved in cell wall biosynthesis
MASDRPTGVLIIVENLPFPLVRRAMQQARTLRDAGYRVSVISVKGEGCEKSYEIMEGIEVYRHRVWEASGPAGYFIEYPLALASQLYLAIKAYRRTHFRVVHTWNPPDVMFVIGWIFKHLCGARYIFDHLDLNPELYLAKFGREDLFYRLVCAVERATFRTADVSLATNQSYRDIAIERGGMRPERVFIVRVSPEPEKMRRRESFPELKRGRKNLVVYLGVMGPQDGVDLWVEGIDYIVNQKKRADTFFTIIGSGTEVPRLKAMVAAKKLDSLVHFTGRISAEELARYLSTGDVGVAPDPFNPMNDKSTMGKILEYMSFNMPVVLFELTEGRRSAGDAALYARPNDPIDFAEKVIQLLDSEPLRRDLGDRGRKRIEENDNWEIDRQRLAAYEMALQSPKKR